VNQLLVCQRFDLLEAILKLTKHMMSWTIKDREFTLQKRKATVSSDTSVDLQGLLP
ncbi:hypothetical protein Cadr_000000222, partial [Camelus dromedarius]